MKKIILSLLVFLVFISGLLVYLVPPIIQRQGETGNTVDYTFNLMITPFRFNLYPESWYLPNIQILILIASIVMVLGLIIFLSFDVKYSLLIPVWVLLIDNVINICYTLFGHFRFSVNDTIGNLLFFLTNKLLIMSYIWTIIAVILLKIINSLTFQKKRIRRITMNTTSQIRQQAKDFANLTNNNDKNTFLNSQKEAFLLMSSEEKLEHFRAIQQRTEELKQKMQKHSFA